MKARSLLGAGLPAANSASSSGQLEEGCLRIVVKGDDVGRPQSQQIDDFRRLAIANADPNHLWRVAENKAPLVEVSILRDDREAIGDRVVPDFLVAGGCETDIANMG